MRELVLSEDLIRNFRVCNCNTINVPYTYALSREYYDKYYHRMFRHLIPHSYVGIIESHEDTYVHCTSKENAEKIMSDGVLRCRGRDENTLGSAVYSYPLGAGRIFSFTNLVAIVFTTDAEHVHLVDAEDSDCVLGEADFLQDVQLSTAKIVSLDELNELSRSNWDSRTSLYKYYGIKQEEVQASFKEPTMEQLPEFLYNFVVGASFWRDKNISTVKVF